MEYPKNLPTGCYVDESAGSADDCNERAIGFAADHGFTFAPIAKGDDRSTGSFGGGR